MSQSHFHGDRVTNSREDLTYKNNKYSTFIIMEQLRKETGNPKLCYMDLSPLEQEAFNERVRQFEVDHPSPKCFQSLEYQQQFYEKKGIFVDISEERLREMFQEAEKDRITQNNVKGKKERRTILE